MICIVESTIESKQNNTQQYTTKITGMFNLFINNMIKKL